MHQIQTVKEKCLDQKKRGRNEGREGRREEKKKGEREEKKEQKREKE